jgi:hypothetical protein
MPQEPSTLDKLRTALDHSILLNEVRDLRIFSRAMAVLLAGITGYKLMLEPGLLILTTDGSLLFKAASMGRHPDAIGWTLIAASAFLIPYQVQQALAPGWGLRRLLARQAVYALLITSFVWLYLLASSVRMEADALPAVLLLNAGCCLVFAAALGLGLNAEMARMRSEEST